MKYAHTELTSSIIEAAVEVQRSLGGAFSKDIFQRALVAELSREGIDAEVDVAAPLFYKGDEIGERHVDVAVEGMVAVEVETVQHYQIPDLERAMRHLRASGMETGLLLNFGPSKLNYVRLYVQGCRSDILIGDSIQHLPERGRLYSANRYGKKTTASNPNRGGQRRRWIPLWLRGKRLQ